MDVIVWIIENEMPDKNLAEKTINKTFEELELQVLWSRMWNPPKFVDEDNPGISRIAESEPPPPDIVVLDLFDQNESFMGSGFYHWLREEQDNKQAFIIVWSDYTGYPKAEAFIGEKSKDDDRLVCCAMKGCTELSSKLDGCYKRLNEES